MGIAVRENMAPGRGSGEVRFPVDRCRTRPGGMGKAELDAGGAVPPRCVGPEDGP